MGNQSLQPARVRAVEHGSSSHSWSSTLIACFVLGLLAPASEAFAQGLPPYVAGFERFVRPTAAASSDAGVLLLGELNCVTCHVQESGSRSIEPKLAPRLRGLGARVSPEYLVNFLESPAVYLHGSTMPSVVSNLAAGDRTDAAVALTDYLVAADNRSFTRVPPDEAAVERGRTLYHQTGCIACHDRMTDEASQPLAHSRPFPDLTLKYSHEGLRRFLSNPLEVRPSGRMPHMRLGGRDTSDIAHFLLRKTKVPGHLKYELSYGRATLDDLDKVTLYKTGQTDSFSLKVAERSNDYFLRFSGFLRVDEPAEFSFRIKADEGARLNIDGTVIAEVANGTRGRSTDRGRVRLDKGWHPIQLDYYQRGRDAVLELKWSGPGFELQDIPASVLRATAEEVPPLATWTVDPGRVETGRRLFTQLQCNTCHESPEGKPRQPVADGTPALARLNPALGCLGPEETRKTCPDFGLDDLQRASIREALMALESADKSQSVADAKPAQIHAQMTRLNCYACHERSNVGGVSDERNALFTSNEIDLGDEGRLPPRLTGVGDKLQSEWLHSVLNRGESVRPYMRARMPVFGEANVKGLAQHLIDVDRKPFTLPVVADTGEAARTAGRTLSGKRKLNCIGCHMFNGHKLAGIQFMDLTTTTRRLNEDWFYRYLLNPAEFRPGTRMPTAWPNGNALFDDVLEGGTDRQIRALWTYLSDGSRAVNPDGLVPRNLELVVGGRAIIYRNKLWEAGFRGIAVGHPEHMNMAFDAESMRLALIWKGDFLNVTAHWGVQGMGRIRPNGFDVLTFPHGPPLAVLKNANEPWPEATGREAGYRFRGYSLGELDRPTFEFDYRDLAVRDFMTVNRVGRKEHFERTIQVKSKDGSESQVWLRLWEGEQIDRDGDHKFRCGQKLRLTLPSDFAGRAVIRDGDSTRELIVPLTAGSTIKVGYEW